MINPIHLVKEIIRPTLKDLGQYSDNAERLILGTACKESDCGYSLVQVGGPALNIYQAEAPSYVDNVEYLKRHPALDYRFGLCTTMLRPWKPEALRAESIWNFKLATAMCRIHYLRFPEPIPDNLNAQAEYWKRLYNSNSGKGTVDEYIRAWHQYVGNNLIL